MNAADLTPDALAKLEAKLLAELETVRKVRALLVEHQIHTGPAAPAPTPPLVAFAAPAAPPPPPVPPQKSYEEILAESLREMAPEGFVIGTLKDTMRKKRKGGLQGEEERAKQDIGRLIRQGRVEVVRSSIGRIGNTYRYLPTAEELAAKAAAEAANATTSAENPAPSAAKPGADAANGHPPPASASTNAQSA